MKNSHFPIVRLGRLVTLALVLVSIACPASGLAALPTPSAASGDAVAQAAAQPGTVRVVVALKQPYASASASERQAVIARVQSQTIDRLKADAFRLVHRYETIAGMSGVVTAAGLDALRRNPDVQAVSLDMPLKAMLEKSAPLIRADRVWNDLGLTGLGVNVAVLDTGVDGTHPDLSDHIVAQHCFNKGSCPPDNSDEGESALDENGHGTHVAGILASRGRVSSRGIAPDAGLVAVRVMDQNGSGWNSDLIAAIDWVITNQSRYNIRVMNLSLGGGRYSGVCDTLDANLILQSQALGAARQAGIITFVASGNEGQSGAMAAPACISSAVSVGAVYDSNFGPLAWPSCADAATRADQIACFSNSSPTLNLLAPGSIITSDAPGGKLIAKSGTSMAAPHAAGVAALMLQAWPNLTPAEAAATLKVTGVAIRDPRNNRVTPRIDALSAVTRVISDHAQSTHTPISGTVLLQSSHSVSGTRIYWMPVACQPALTPQSGAPSTLTDVQGRFQFTSTLTGNATCLQVVRRGYLIGQKSAPQGNVGTLTLPAGDVTGDDAIDIFDVTFIASRYGSNDPLADVTGDGAVDIFDLTLVANNLGLSGPITQWR